MAWDFQQCGMCDQQSLRSACTYEQSDQSLCQLLEYSMSVKLLNEHNLEFLSRTGDCTGSSESTLVKMPHCWKSRVMAQLVYKHIISWLCATSVDPDTVNVQCFCSFWSSLLKNASLTMKHYLLLLRHWSITCM